MNISRLAEETPGTNMEDAHYVVLFAGLIFRKNPAANDRSGVTEVTARQPEIERGPEKKTRRLAGRNPSDAYP
jgi:hypothetical protein